MIDDIKGFPVFLASVVVGLLRAAITEVEVLLIVILGIAVGFAIGPLEGLVAFLIVYVTFRMISQIAFLFAQRIEALIRSNND